MGKCVVSVCSNLGSRFESAVVADGAMSKRKAERTSHVRDKRKKHSVVASEHSDGASEHEGPDHDDARLQEALHLYDRS